MIARLMLLVLTASMFVLLVLTASMFASCNDGTHWSDINPDGSDLHPMRPNAAAGGRVNGLAAAHDGSAIYAATEWGGLYKSTDEGRHWSALRRHFPMVTWKVAVDPSNPQRVYATSLYDGRRIGSSLAGINVSTDGGQTWTHPPPARDLLNVCSRVSKNNPSAFGISIDPSNSLHVVVGTNCGAIESKDAGSTWNYIFPLSKADEGIIWSVMVHDGGIIDICGDQGHFRGIVANGVLRFNANTLPSSRCLLAVSPLNKDWLFAVVGSSRFESSDGGQNWAQYQDELDADQGGGIPFFATNKRANNRYDLWFGHVDLYRRTCDVNACLLGGSTYDTLGFRSGAHFDAGDLLFDPTVSIDACPWLYANDGGIERNAHMRDANCQDVKWQQPDVSPHALWVRGLDGSAKGAAPTTELYVGTQDNGFFAANGATPFSPQWQHVAYGDASDVVASANRVVYALCCGDSDNKTVFAGRSLGLGSSALSSLAPLVNGDVEIAQFANRGYGFMTVNGLIVTPNITALTLSNPSNPPFRIDPFTLGTLEVAVSNGIPTFFLLLTQLDQDLTTEREKQVWMFDQNGAWSKVSAPGNSGGFGIFAADASDPLRMIASHMPPRARPRMVLSTDGGASWTRLHALDVCMTRRRQFRFENDGGLSAGLTGRPGTSMFLGYAQPTFAAFDPVDRQLIVAGARDAGVFLSSDGGTSWLPLTDPFGDGQYLPWPSFAYFDHTNAALKLYVGTKGGGVWRLEIQPGLRSTPLGSC